MAFLDLGPGDNFVYWVEESQPAELVIKEVTTGVAWNQSRKITWNSFPK